MVGANLLFFSVEPYTPANEVAASFTPDMEWHFKADDENALV